MMRSMMSAVSGLRAQQTAMDVIGNNIANVNTAGFKASNTNFTDLFYQTLQQGTEAVNPTQVGYGSQVSSVDKNMSSTGATNTDNALDLYVDGEGFFTVNTKLDGTGTTYFTRLGNFHIDSTGHLADSNGNYVLGAQGSGNNVTPGAPINLMGATFHSTTGQIIQIDSSTYKQLSDIQVNTDGTISAAIGDQVGVISNDTIANGQYGTVTSLAGTTATAPTGGALINSAGNAVYDASGAVNLYGLKVGSVTIDASNVADCSNIKLNANNTISLDYDDGTTSITGGTLMQADGTTQEKYVQSGSVNTTTGALTDAMGSAVDDPSGNAINLLGMAVEGADGNGFTVDANNIGNITSATFNADNTVTVNYKDDSGVAHTGTLKDITQNDQTIALATFVNPNGLNQAGDSYYTADTSSGSPSYVIAGDGNSTVIRSGELEMSNVDLAKEFTNMIVTERGFQANSRVITVSDSMLEELVNLKRS